MKTQIIELTPVDGQKSFNKKCYVVDSGDSKALISYQTKVAEVINGKLHIYGWHSATTQRHLNSFFAFAGFPQLTKSEILKQINPKQ